MSRTKITNQTEQLNKTTQMDNSNKMGSDEQRIVMPAPVDKALQDFDDFDDDADTNEFSLAMTELERYEVTDEIKVRNAFFNARDKRTLTKDGNYCIFFAQGKFDNWCAYIAKRDSDYLWHLYAPKDEYYFARVLYIAREQEKAYPNRKESAYSKLYHEILHIAEIMFFDPRTVQDSICAEIDRIVKVYSCENESYRVKLTLALYELYYGMIAEENKEGTILGRKIKMIGLHDLLINRRGVKVSCDCNKNVSSGSIQNECDNLGLCWTVDTDTN